MTFDKDKFIIKLTSRKLWVSIISFVTLILTSKGMDSGSIEQISAIIMAGASALGYVFAEGLVDAAGRK